MRDLTKRQQEVYSFIEQYIQDHSYPPTIREVSLAFAISVKAAHDHINSLIKKEWLRRSAHQSRSLELLVKKEVPAAEPEVIDVPLLGEVAAGLPILAEENLEGSLTLPVSLLGAGRHFALRVRGDSMLDAGIHGGDIAVVRQQSTASDGDIVVALLEDSATLKRYYRESNRIRLQAENPAYSPIYTQNVQILGRMVHLLRSYL